MRWAAAVALMALVVLSPAAALADPAGPTDYETTIVSIEPEVDGLSARMLGGDSFLELTTVGHDVLITGYRGEPYLRFDADGTVYENARSETTYLNQDRYGETEVPATADPDADPEWVEVASDGRYAWHDHRTHWMVEEPPPGAEPGDTVLEAVVPLEVDGEPVLISVRSLYVEPPGPWASSVGGAIGLVVSATLVRLMGRASGARASLLGLGTAALTMGIWERLSMPPEAAASPLVFLLPAGTLLFAWMAKPSAPTQAYAGLLSALSLGVWVWLRWEVLLRPILPTAAPWQMDRLVTAAAATGTVVVLWHLLAGLLGGRSDRAEA